MTKAGDVAREFAGAKINLALHVTGTRPDGYHLLDSLVVFADDVGDTVIASFAEREVLTVEGPFASSLSPGDLKDNLVVRAAALLAPERAPSIHLTLVKRIPVAAGLGGGSADAAATLRLLAERWSMKLDPQALATIGRSLGADVPMCLASLPLVARGVGDQLIPLAGMPALPVVLACPPVAVRTVDVFAALGEANLSPLPPLPAAFATPREVATWLGGTRNDLAGPAAALAPEAAAAAAALQRQPECLFARMSGSGPAAFGIFHSREYAGLAAARLAAAEPTWWVTAAVTGGS